MYFYEEKAREKGYKLICGVDEVGRGPLAGPVVSAAVIYKQLPKETEINDSKKLTPKKRERLLKVIMNSCYSFSIGIVWPKEIDEMNIHEATLLSMKRAVDKFKIKPDYILVDGIHKIKGLDIEQETIKQGDSKSISIASASIIAKVTRDNIMKSYDNIYPGFGFSTNSGYGSASHMSVLNKDSVTPIHRRSYAPVKDF